jgi:phosphoglycolate phosphatase
MFAQLWPELSDEDVETLVATFRTHYDAEGCRLSQLYPDVAETLHTLHSNGVALFVLTNKPRQATRVILEHLGVVTYFTALISPDTKEPPFAAKSEGAKQLLTEYNLEPAATLVVGDGTDDAEAADACGFSFLVAGYGYGSAARGVERTNHRSVKTFPSILRAVL